MKSEEFNSSLRRCHPVQHICLSSLRVQMGQKESSIAVKPVDEEGVKRFVHSTSLRERGLSRQTGRKRFGKVGRVCTQTASYPPLILPLQSLPCEKEGSDHQ